MVKDFTKYNIYKIVKGKQEILSIKTAKRRILHIVVNYLTNNCNISIERFSKFMTGENPCHRTLFGKYKEICTEKEIFRKRSYIPFEYRGKTLYVIDEWQKCSIEELNKELNKEFRDYIFIEEYNNERVN